MLVSIITPTYRRPERVKVAIRSLLAQTYPAWEAVIIDDGDGEGLAAAESFGDPRIRTLPNPDRGQVAARNAGVRAARGEVIALLDDDDWWDDPGHLSLIVEALEPGPALVHRHGWLVRERTEGMQERELFALPASPERLRQDNTLLTSSLAYPRTLHDQLGPFDHEVGSYFDWDWILRVLSAGYLLCTLASPGISYLVHQQMVSDDLTNPRRVAYFERFCVKHGLTLTSKNHALLLAEQRSGSR